MIGVSVLAEHDNRLPLGIVNHGSSICNDALVCNLDFCFWYLVLSVAEAILMVRRLEYRKTYPCCLTVEYMFSSSGFHVRFMNVKYSEKS